MYFVISDWVGKKSSLKMATIFCLPIIAWIVASLHPYLIDIEVFMDSFISNLSSKVLLDCKIASYNYILTVLASLSGFLVYALLTIIGSLAIYLLYMVKFNRIRKGKIKEIEEIEPQMNEITNSDAKGIGELVEGLEKKTFSNPGA